MLHTIRVRKIATDMVGEQFPGFTVYSGTGVWKNTEEDVIIFEILTDDIAEVNKAKEVATRLKNIFYRTQFYYQSTQLMENLYRT